MSSASSAVRVRLHRLRLASGKRLGRIEYDLTAVSDRLIEAGFLSAPTDNDADVDRAIEKMLQFFTEDISS
jgi:hypothetical protein